MWQVWQGNLFIQFFCHGPLNLYFQAKRLGVSEEEVVKKIMLVNTVDTQFTTVEDVAEV